MTLDRRGHGDKVVNFRRTGLRDPVREEPRRVELRLRVGVDRTQLLLENVGRADVRVLREHPVQPRLGPGVSRDVLGVHQQQPHVSLEILLRLLLTLLRAEHYPPDRLPVLVGRCEFREPFARVGVDPSHGHPADVVDVLVHLHDDVEVVEDDQRVLAQVPAHPCVVGVRHVHADAPDAGQGLLLLQPVGEHLQRSLALAPGHVQDASRVKVSDDGDELAVLPLVAEDIQLVNADPRHSLEVDGLVLGFQDALLRVPDRPPVYAELLRDGRDRGVRALRDDEPLERPRDAGLGARHEREPLLERLAAVRAPEPSYVDLDIAAHPPDVMAADPAHLALARHDSRLGAPLAFQGLVPGSLRFDDEDERRVAHARLALSALRRQPVACGVGRRRVEDDREGRKRNERRLVEQEGEFAGFKCAAAGEDVGVANLARTPVSFDPLGDHLISADACDMIQPWFMHFLLLWNWPVPIGNNSTNRRRIWR